MKKRVEAPSSVGVDSMDDEHKECADAFNLVIANSSSENLRILYDTLKSHFDHEEALITKYIHNSTSFSSLNSHKMDHERILKIANDELYRVNGCGLNGQWHKIPVDLAVVREIADAFHKHAEQFDSLYESKIPVSAD